MCGGGGGGGGGERFTIHSPQENVTKWVLNILYFLHDRLAVSF